EANTGEAASSLRDFDAAGQEAARGRDDRAAALAWMGMAYIHRRTRKLERAAALEPVMRAAVTRAGNDPDLRVELEVNLAATQRELGNLVEAERGLRAALALVPA